MIVIDRHSFANHVSLATDKLGTSRSYTVAINVVSRLPDVECSRARRPDIRKREGESERERGKTRLSFNRSVVYGDMHVAHFVNHALFA